MFDTRSKADVDDLLRKLKAVYDEYQAVLAVADADYYRTYNSINQEFRAAQDKAVGEIKALGDYDQVLEKRKEDVKEAWEDYAEKVVAIVLAWVKEGD